jgi:ubiquinone biosynthesis protein
MRMKKTAAAPPGEALDEGLRQLLARGYRTAVVLGVAAVAAVEYLRVQRVARRLPPERATLLWERQHRRTAKRLARVAIHLKGLLIKSGQYLSARPDLLPEPFIEELAGLQDAVPPRPYAQIARRIERELGASPEQLFAEFSRLPVASASLAQVHRARTRDGRLVAVKVLYPGIEGVVRADLRNLGLIVRVVGRIWPRYDFRVIYREAARLVPLELDLRLEAANAERMGANLAHRTDVAVPTIVRELSCARVLTMEYLDGVKITDIAGLRAYGAEPAEIAERVVDLFGDQVIEHGFFHGDPHPGNLLVLPDGRIGLLDFGQTLALATHERRGFALLSYSAARRDPLGMVRAIQMVGIHLPESGMETWIRLAQQTLGMHRLELRDDNVAAAVNVQMARDFRGISFDGISGEALFVFRVQGMLRGLRAQLGNPGNVILTWNSYAARFLAETDENAEAAS